MANIPIGVGKGLAVKHDFAGDISRLYQREKMTQEVRVEKERKAQLYGSMLQKGHVRGKYNTGRLEEYYGQVNNELSSFVINNPTWETDPGLFAKFANITDKFLQNDIIREDVQVQENYKRLQQEVGTGRMKFDEIEEHMDKYSNYIDNGGDPFIFINPKRLEFGDVLDTAVKSVSTSRRTISEGPMLFSVETANSDSIDAAVNTAYADPDQRREIERAYENAGGKAAAETSYQFFRNKVSSQMDFQKTKAGYDQYWLMLQQERTSNPALQDMYGTYIHQPYIAAMENGVDQTLAARSANIALTMFGGKPENRERNINQSMGIKFLNQAPKKSWETEDNYTGMMDFGFNATVRALGAKSFMIKNGQAYVETDIKLALPIDQNGEPLNLGMEKTLIDQGFALSEISTEDSFGSTYFGSKKIRPKYYTGTVLIPAIMNQNTMLDYNRNTYGEASMKTFYQNMSEFQQQEIEARFVELNKKFPDKGLSIVNGEIIYGNGKYGIDPITEQHYKR